MPKWNAAGHASGNSLIEKKDAARAIFRALQRNEAVGVLVDQNVSPSEGVVCEFLRHARVRRHRICPYRA